MSNIVHGFDTENGPAKYDYNSLANLPTNNGGLSAYEIAKKNGFNGTESAWLASLKGEQGENGKDAVYSDEDKQALAELKNIVTLDVSDGIIKTITGNKIVFKLDKSFIKNMIQ